MFSTFAKSTILNYFNELTNSRLVYISIVKINL